MQMAWRVIMGKGEGRNRSRGQKLTALGLGLSALLIPAALIFHFQSPAFLSFSGTPPQTSYSVTLQQGKEVHSLSPSRDKNNFYANKTFSPDRSYRILASLQDDRGYRDITLIRDADKNLLQFQASGFEPGDILAVTENGDRYWNELHFDWSGRIELEIPLPATASEICFKTESFFSLCHDVSEGAKA
jgi:hypothetical protein